MKKIEYSIIIPHKDIPDLLKRCVRSIPQRSDLEIIVVDDNSKCDISKITNEINRPNFTFIRNSVGKGAGAARNAGLQLSRGRQIIFADADDFFTDDFNKVLDKYHNTNFDIIFFKISSKYSDTLEPSPRGDFINQMIDSAVMEGTFEHLKYKRLEPWAKIYSKDLIEINGIKFDETPAANDLMFSILAASKANKLAVDQTVVYCLTQRQGSLAYSKTKENCLAKINVIAKVNKFLITKGKGTFHINIFPYILNTKHLSNRLFLQYMLLSFSLYRFDYVLKDLFISLYKTFHK